MNAACPRMSLFANQRICPLRADSDEENRSFRADDDQLNAEGRRRKYCGTGDRHGSRERFGIGSASFRFFVFGKGC